MRPSRRLALFALALLLTLVAHPPRSRAAVVNDPALRVQTWTRGLQSPTGVAILPGGGGTMLVTEKNTGRVRVVFGKSVIKTALDLPVANDSERGLLGIATPPDFATSQQVYLYYTAAASDGGSATEHRIERYNWDAADRTLTLDRRIKTLPATPGPNHDGGKIAFGPDGKLYAVIGDLNRNERTLNFANDTVNRVGAILRMNPSGSAVQTNPFYNSRSPGSPVSDIFAYGVRNSFGLAFDPQTGALWDTENGPDRMDEINRVRPGFNSGWERIMGPAGRDAEGTGDLVSLGSAAKYEDPKFSWVEPVAPTDLEFMNSGRLGGQYNGDLFVGALQTGQLLRFDLTSTRNAFSLRGGLADRVADNSPGDLTAEQAAIAFGSGFGVISDLTVGPGGLYVLSLDGQLYRVTTAGASGGALTASGVLSLTAASPAGINAVPEPATVAGLLAMAALMLRRTRETRP